MSSNEEQRLLKHRESNKRYRERKLLNRTPAQIELDKQKKIEQNQRYREKRKLSTLINFDSVENVQAKKLKKSEQNQRYNKQQKEACTHSPEQSTITKLKKSEQNQRYNDGKKARIRSSEELIAAKLKKSEQNRIYREKKKHLQILQLQHQNCNNSDNNNNNNSSSNPPIILNWFEKHMQEKFFCNTLDRSCNICDRIQFQNDVTKIHSIDIFDRLRDIGVIEASMSKESCYVCRTCMKSIREDKIPLMSRYNGFDFPPTPPGLPDLDEFTERLISPRIPFMQINKVHYFPGAKRLIGQVVNVPVDLKQLYNVLPRLPDDNTDVFIHLKRHILHRAVYMSGCVNKSTMISWLKYLITTPLYCKFNINMHPLYLNDEADNDDSAFADEDEMENIRRETFQCYDENDLTENELLLMQQSTILWDNNTDMMSYAPGQNEIPLAITFDENVDELTFPSIFYGTMKKYKISATPFMEATSEVRRVDRRASKSQYILFLAAKLIRLNMLKGSRIMFRNTSTVTNITRRNLQNDDFVMNSLQSNFAFMQNIPNTFQYWRRRKRDLFAMMRQLGKPTIFLTLSASETSWPHLLKTLFKYKYPDAEFNLESLSKITKAILVNEDPVVTCMYFNKLVHEILQSLMNKLGPFKNHRVIDFFKRIEFQHRGSPHAHILLWLEGVTDESTQNEIPLTEALVDKLITTDIHEYTGPRPEVQIHKHTATCYKKHNKVCRFGAPFWPMLRTRAIIPAIERDPIKYQRYVSAHNFLEHNTFDSIEDFFDAIEIDNEDEYIEMLANGFTKAKVLPKRHIDDIWINPFNVEISGILNSNMDIQYILDERACAMYVADYINKATRGYSCLKRELSNILEKNPDMEESECWRQLAKESVNKIEICSQEAAWYLLRLPMSETSTQVAYIHTEHPSERTLVRRTEQQLCIADVDMDATDVWKESVIEQYEQRPESLENVYLAEYVAWYYKVTKRAIVTSNDKSNSYARRNKPRIIRWRTYNSVTFSLEYKREQVLLFLPFRSEHADLLEKDKYIDLYDSNRDLLCERLNKFTKIKIDLEDLEREQDDFEESGEGLNSSHKTINVESDFKRRDDKAKDVDFDIITKNCVVRRIENRMTKHEYKINIMNANDKQTKFTIIVIESLLYNSKNQQVNVFLSGVAGTGKSYLLHLLMETINRYTKRSDRTKNAYVACGMTGKAAVNINGITLHSAFKFNFDNQISDESLHMLRCDFSNVSYIIVDEVSMMGSDLLAKLDKRLKQIGRNASARFGGFHVILCGDLRQLPPVKAKPIYTRPPNTLQSDMLWQNFMYFPLTEVIRQKDKQFINILTKIGNGEELEQCERNILNNRFFTNEASELDKTSVRLFYENRKVDAYNKKMMADETMSICRAFDEITGTKDKTQKDKIKLWLEKSPPSKTNGLPTILCLNIGKLYCVTQNIDSLDRIVNGSKCYLRFIEYDGCKKTPNRLWMEFLDPLAGAAQRLKYKSHAHLLKLHKNWTPIVQRDSLIHHSVSLVRLRRVQFPVVENCASSIHKSQGDSYDSVVYEYSKKHELSLVYVALSRARTLEGLHLTNDTNDHQFYHLQRPTTNKKFSMEQLRLNGKQIYSIVDKIDDFVSNCTFSLYFVNCQNLHENADHVVKQRIMDHIDVLALAETWLTEDIKNGIPIKGYKCVISNSTDDRSSGTAIYLNANTKMKALHVYDIPHYEIDPLFADTSAAKFEYVEDGVKRTVIVMCFYFHHKKANRTRAIAFIKWLLEKMNISALEPNVICGDLNINMLKPEGEGLIKDMDALGFRMTITPQPTTYWQTGLDYTFVRNINLKSELYLDYYTHHRPIVSVLGPGYYRTEDDETSVVFYS